MTDFDKVRAILDAATPTEWHWHTYGHATVRRAAGRVTRALFSNPFHSTDLTWVHTEDEDGPNIALTGNGAKSWDNARAIVVAVNLIDPALAVVEAARDYSPQNLHDWRCERRTKEVGWKNGDPPVIQCECGYDELEAALAAFDAAMEGER